MKIGDVVVLKGYANATQMCVGGTNGMGFIRCQWFEGTSLREAFFNPDCIELFKLDHVQVSVPREIVEKAANHEGRCVR